MRVPEEENKWLVNIWKYFNLINNQRKQLKIVLVYLFMPLFLRLSKIYETDNSECFLESWEKSLFSLPVGVYIHTKFLESN